MSFIDIAAKTPTIAKNTASYILKVLQQKASYGEQWLKSVRLVPLGFESASRSFERSLKFTKREPKFLKDNQEDKLKNKRWGQNKRSSDYRPTDVSGPGKNEVVGLQSKRRKRKVDPTEMTLRT